ncbi:hypothetical protein LD112_00405 [Pantoea agglomerans]|nr:hypothetical protein [Pantoea agglomerans]
MKLRTLGRTGQRVSEIGFGAWAIGGTWGGSEHGGCQSRAECCAGCGHHLY